MLFFSLILDQHRWKRWFEIESILAKARWGMTMLVCVIISRCFYRGYLILMNDLVNLKGWILRVVIVDQIEWRNYPLINLLKSTWDKDEWFPSFLEDWFLPIWSGQTINLSLLLTYHVRMSWVSGTKSVRLGWPIE